MEDYTKQREYIKEKLNLTINDCFLQGQLELHKIEFSETGDNKHLRIMLQFKETLDSFRFLREQNERLSGENFKLKGKTVKDLL